MSSKQRNLEIADRIKYFFLVEMSKDLLWKLHIIVAKLSQDTVLVSTLLLPYFKDFYQFVIVSTKIVITVLSTPGQFTKLSNLALTQLTNLY